IDHAHAFGVEAKFLHLLHGQFAEGIVTDSADEANVTAELCDRNRLIGALAAEADAIARCIHGLSRTRQRGHPRADIHIHTAENKNLQRFSPSLCRGTLTGPKQNFHAGLVAMHREKRGSRTQALFVNAARPLIAVPASAAFQASRQRPEADGKDAGGANIKTSFASARRAY